MENAQPLDKSVLNSVKDFLGIGEDDKAFDSDLMIYINGSLVKLNQAGVGDVFIISDSNNTWSEFVTLPEQINVFAMIQLFVCLEVKLIFDPPAPATLTVMEQSAKELLWRLEVACNVERSLLYGQRKPKVHDPF